MVDADYLDDLGIVNVGEAIAQLPANISNNQPTTTGNANFFAGSTIANLRGLNPFFGSRTLNLVNNRRFVPTNQGDGVDLNFIPKILIERMDVVTGGASAAYGSGAISGVNNIFLTRRLEGGRAEFDFAQTSESDGDDAHVGLAYGMSLFDGRGHAVIGYEWQDADPVGCDEARDWCARGVAFIQNPNAGQPGEPQFLLRENVRANQRSYTGVFNNLIPGAAETLQVNPEGTGVVPFNIGQGASGSPFNNVVGGDGRHVHLYTNLRAPVERNVATGMFTFDVTDTVTMSVDLSWGEVETLNITAGLDSNFVPIAADNPFLTPEIAAARDQFAIFPGGPAFFNKDWNAQINSYSLFTTDVLRGAIGFDGRFGESSWTWDTYYQYGNTDRMQLVQDNLHLNAFNLAVDAVRADPNDPNSEIVCRVTRDGVPAFALYDPRIAEGCVPLNPFGTQPLDPAAYAYAWGFLRENLDYTQQVLAGSVSGDLWQGFGAGPVQAAAGLEFRREKGENIAAEELDPWDRTDFLIQYGESFAGEVDVIEAFVEFNLPLLRGAPGAELLEINTAARISRYENQGLFGTTGEQREHDMTTWKVSAVYDPLDWLRLRGTRSRDARAANFRELYYGQLIRAGGLFGFCGPTGTTFTDPCDWSLEGNVNLDPEKADTTTVGFVLTPEELMPGLQFAADYFHIEIEDAIQQANIRRVLDGCQISGIEEFCALIVPDVPGVFVYDPDTGTGVSSIRALAFNGSGYEYEGIDFSGTYRLDIGDAGALNFRLIATKMLDQNFQPTPGQPFVNIVGQTGTANSFLSDNQPTAEWIANFTSTYTAGPLSVTGQVRYVDDGVMNYLGITPDDPGFPVAPVGGVTMDANRVPSYAVVGLSGSYMFENVGFLENLQVWGAVDNVFDKDPPIASGTGFGGGTGGTNPVFFDTMGRMYRLGIRTSF